MSNNAEPCNMCGERMHTQRVPVWTGYDMTYNYFLLCSKCGHGPTDAHESELEAVVAWNRSLDKKNTVNG